MKTKTVTIKYPSEMRLGQAIMNAYREEWINDSLTPSFNIWEQDHKQIQDKINKFIEWGKSL